MSGRHAAVLVVDSTVWIDYFNGRVTPQTDHLDRILSLQPILVGDLILAEVLQGFRSDAEFDRAPGTPHHFFNS